MLNSIRLQLLTKGAARWFHAAGLLSILAFHTGPWPGPAQVPGYLHTSGNRIVDASGSTVGLSGLNWFGFETSNFAPHGLWTRNWEDMLDQVQALGYNTIRLPFANAMLDANAKASGIDYTLNPDLINLSPLQIMDRIIDGAGARGIRVILDNHRSTAGGGPESNGLWYTNQYPESRWISDWKMLVQRYKGNAAVVGVDLRNEPHAGCWGCGDAARDWRLAAEKAGNAILTVNPELLILVEGVSTYNGQTTWWGGNLLGARDHPIRLNVPNRLVYSPHEYPASVYAQSWFNAPNYPDNLPAVWDTYWGFLAADTPILIGEFGTRLETEKDRQWFNKLRDYIQQKQLNWTFWSLNPNSGDTGGVLLDDWTTVHQEKQDVLESMQYAQAPDAIAISTSTPAATPTTGAQSGAAATLLLEDFESGAPGAWTRFQGGGSSLTTSIVSPGQTGTAALKIDYWIASGGWAGAGRDFAGAQDWSMYQKISFGFKGSNSGNTVRFEILDNRAAGSTSDTSERFEYKFTDNFTGWKTFDLPWSAFTRRADWQPPGAPNDGLTLTSMWGLNYSPLNGGGSFQLDQIELRKADAAGATATAAQAPTAAPTSASSNVILLDNFEAGDMNRWTVYRDSRSTVNASVIGPGHASLYAMQINYSIAQDSWGGLEVRLLQPQDWSATASFDFWVYGSNSGNTVRVEVYENRSRDNSDTSERYEYRFVDNTVGWRHINIPWSLFSRRTDWQPGGAPNDGFSRAQIWGYNISPLGGQGSLQFDDLLLLK